MTTLFMLLLCMLPTCFPHLSFASDRGFLTAEERAWLEAHPVITIAPDPDGLPYECLDADGTYRGVSADYLKIIAAELGVRFQVVRAADWSGVLALAHEKAVDILPAVALTEKRQGSLIFTDPYLKVPGVLFSAKSFVDVEDLAAKKVAVVADSVWADLIQHHKVDVIVVETEDLRTAVDLTAMGAVDAMISNLASTTEIISRVGITNLRVIKYLDLKIDVRMGVRRDWPELVTILNKTLATIDQKQRDEIRQRWIKVVDIPWWQDSTLHTFSAFIVGFFVLVIVVVIVWNRSLARQVQKRADELQLAHQQLMQAAKLESVGQLAAGVAHEVKNPLAIIRMGVEYLAGAPDVEEMEQEILGDMEDAVQRADTVIHGLLDFSRDQKLSLKAGEDLNDVIRQSLHLVDHELMKKQISVATDLSDLPFLTLDFSKLQQVFVNLFMNSIHAMEKQGELMVSSEQHILSSDEAGFSEEFHAGMKVVRIRVGDNGKGIAKKEVDRVFDPFYTTKEVGEGTGLGLSVSRNIVELHHGTLQLANCEKGGVCATILLPYGE